MVFEFYIGGHPGPFFDLKVVSSELVIYHGMNDSLVPDLVTVHLGGNAAWKDLLDFLATRKWSGQYLLTGSIDGTNWGLNYITTETSLQAYGSNRYPQGFKKFLSLVNRITIPMGIEVY